MKYVKGYYFLLTALIALDARFYCQYKSNKVLPACEFPFSLKHTQHIDSAMLSMKNQIRKCTDAQYNSDSQKIEVGLLYSVDDIRGSVRLLLNEFIFYRNEFVKKVRFDKRKCRTLAFECWLVVDVDTMYCLLFSFDLFNERYLPEFEFRKLERTKLFDKVRREPVKYL